MTEAQHIKNNFGNFVQWIFNMKYWMVTANVLSESDTQNLSRLLVNALLGYFNLLHWFCI